ncbi:MAG TPA: cupin domain-containing protein [Verrucomicrobiae bacterium]|nr:cupin domain-containing protein [Verrucomicrobiae bacterium]
MHHATAALTRLSHYSSVLAIAICASALTVSAQLAPVKPGVYRWSDHTVQADSNRETRAILEGTSPHLSFLKIHATTQPVGAQPRPARANDDAEELIIVKEGLLKMTFDNHSEVLAAGSVVHLMPGQMHQIANVGDVPLTYYVMKYRSEKPMQLERATASGASRMFDVTKLPLKPSARGAGRAYFDRATAMCERFELHVTQLHQSGPSHAPHSHVESEIILVISGDTEMSIDGKDYKGSAGDFYLVPSNQPHGLRNLSDKPCAYFAFKWK